MKTTIEAEADKIRLQVLKMSDSELVYYSHALHAENFETLPERIKRVSEEYKKTMPF